MLHRHPAGSVWIGTSAEFTASPKKFKKGDLLIVSDSSHVRIGDGVHAYTGLTALPTAGLQQAAFQAAQGATTNLPATAATYADLAAARTSVEALRAGTEARLDAIEAAFESLRAKLVTGNLMAGS